MGLLVCNHALANNPYEMKEESLSIFSIEELTYYLYHNSNYIGKELMCESLCIWIETELSMTNLGLKLKQILHAKGSLEMFVSQIIQATSYCTKDEIETIKQKMQENENRSELEWEKVRTDRYFQQKKYEKALQGYFRILKTESDFLEEELHGIILHNMGVCYARFFLYEEASMYFQEAYKRNPKPEIKKAYEAAMQYKDCEIVPVEKIYLEEEIDMQLEEWKRDYKRHGIF